MPLERSISLPQAILYGIGVIIGAGIYSLIGVAAGITGNLLWLSFVIAGLIAALTAYSYSQLIRMFPKEAAESVYVLAAFNSKKLAFFVGMLSLVTGLFSAATVAWGFAAYFKLFLIIDPLMIAILVILLLSIINFLGIQESVTINNIATFLTIIGLGLIIIFGLRFIGSADLFLGIDGSNFLQNPFPLLPGIFSAAALMFFAYLGFEEIANVSEEMKNARKNAPKAVITALIVTTVIYILISIIAVSVVSPAELNLASNPNIPLTDGPLALVAETAIAPGFGFILSLIALCAISGTIIVLLNVCSRIIYGLSSEGLLPKLLSKTSRRKTPHIAILLVLLAALLLTLVGDIELLGKITTTGTFFLFFTVNASFVMIKLKHGNYFLKKPDYFIILPIIGAVFCISMFLTQYWELVNVFGINMPLILLSIIIFIITFLPYYLFKK